MLKYGMLGDLAGSGDRCIIWDADHEDFDELLKEMSWFMNGLQFFTRDSGKLWYGFYGKDKRHELDVEEEFFCFTFSTGHLTRLPKLDVYKDFVRLI